MATVNEIYSLSEVGSENFHVRVQDNAVNQENARVQFTTTEGQVIDDLTNSNGLTPEYLILSNQTLNITVTPDGGNPQIFNYSFVVGSSPLVCYVANIQGPIAFTYPIAQPIRMVNHDNTNYSNTLFENIKVGKNEQVKDGYCIKRLRDKTEDITVNSGNSSAIELKIFDIETTLQVGSTMNLVEAPTGVWNINFQWGSTPAGYYYLELGFSDGVSIINTARSEPIVLRDSFTGCLEITYTNFDNAYGITFNRVPNLIPYYILISADILPEDDDTSLDIYLDDENTATLLHDEVLDVYRIQTLCPLPFYYVKTLQIALGMDQVSIGGEEYVKKSQGTRKVFGPYGLMFNFSIQIQKKKFDQINYFNKTELAT